MTNTRKIKVPEILPTEYRETHNKPGTSRKSFASNDSANLRCTLGAMSDEQFKAFMKSKEDEFLKILLGGK